MEPVAVVIKSKYLKSKIAPPPPPPNYNKLRSNIFLCKGEKKLSMMSCFQRDLFFTKQYWCCAKNINLFFFSVKVISVDYVQGEWWWVYFGHLIDMNVNQGEYRNQKKKFTFVIDEVSRLGLKICFFTKL